MNRRAGVLAVAIRADFVGLLPGGRKRQVMLIIAHKSRTILDRIPNQ
jgi:hypothetical protein